jgi:hypothetical protein
MEHLAFLPRCSDGPTLHAQPAVRETIVGDDVAQRVVDN